MTITSTSSRQPVPRPSDGVATRARALTARALRSTYDAFVVYGWLLVGPVPPADGASDGPAPGHPERLCHRPLNRVERALERQLTG